MKQLGLGESALRWGGRLSAFVAMLALGRHSTLDLHLHWPTGHFRMRCIYGLGKHLSESVIEYSNGLGAYDPAFKLAIHVSSGVLRLVGVLRMGMCRKSTPSLAVLLLVLLC